jgi:hypothetical protein
MLDVPEEVPLDVRNSAEDNPPLVGFLLSSFELIPAIHLYKQWSY